jgi:glycosyltransferase involved in cell wall biosynthesis
MASYDGKRVAVYNRFWRSYGGGERHAGMVAQVLSEAGAEVDLIGHDDVDRDALADHLGLDLSRCRMLMVDDSGPSTLSEFTGDYDLLVNGSYMSNVPSKAHRSLYVCYFPTPPDHTFSAMRRRVAKLLRPIAVSSPADQWVWGTGWFPSEGGRRRTWIWTSGEGILVLPAGPEFRLRMDLGRPGRDSTQVRILLDSEPFAMLPVTSSFQKHILTIPASTAARTLTFVSDTFSPGGSDSRKLGIAVSRLRPANYSFDPRARIGYRFPWLAFDPNDLRWLSTYDVVLANSEYTGGWIEHYWDRTPEVLYPPIQVDRFHPAPAREKAIVTAGRFFVPENGHSKRQLEQVQTFTRMVDQNRLPGWTLHLIGGCEPSQQGYVDSVRAAAEGYPVELHVNAPRDLLENIMSTASIVWSATGYGEDEENAPWASEHFGMTTVEAMAGGCVPIVIDRAGQKEIVRQGVDGFRWETLDELADRTVEVATNSELRAGLAQSAVKRAQIYSDAAFAQRLHDIVERDDLL